VTTAAVVCSAVVKTILCYGDSNTWGCIPLTGAHRSSDNDGIHLDAPSHEQLGVVVAQHVRRLLA
jgi:hypothetical protein